ncbi:CHASE3 domain-containing protein [Paucibacter sp. PLA-PC-4]|uniref:CHASE3 domain-containing protein n=1 Tax=Paucibacter sp. PLA-PC-4 TaxID=2993655 RepID=UPI00224A9850|nr:CHASE3 domain-containing protein [Paucibacter sp. PLA-PC-4]MCX2863533.1 CHASE3 domain-containing protein [Paucibacter sp. PLA-PC-4]
MHADQFALLERLQRSAYVFPLAVLAAALMISISEGSYVKARGTLTELTEMGRARLMIYNIKLRATDAESAQRGYLLTRRREYLGPYEEANEDLSRAMKSLRAHYQQLEDEQALTLLAQLEQALGAKMGELAEVLERQERGRADSALELIQAGIGRDQMELIRARAEELMHRENLRVGAGLREVVNALLQNRIGVAAMTALSLLALAMYLRQSRALSRQRLALAEAVKAERDVLESEVHRRTEELTQLATHLQSAREDERSRLARELHDELGALLTAAKLDAARIKPKLPPELQERLSHLNEALNSGIALKRRIIEDLRPSSLTHLGLLPALEIQAREFSERLEVPVLTELEAVPLSPRAELTIYRLVQEAFTNIAKYANASEIQVRLLNRDGRALVEVRDNGQGFDTKQQTLSSHGLLGMRYRVAAEGGQLMISSVRGQGTVLSASLPLPAPSPPPAAPL